MPSGPDAVLPHFLKAPVRFLIISGSDRDPSEDT